MSGSSSVLALKLLISLASLLPPTILMGGTLPVLVRYLTRSLHEAGSNIAILYFLNSFGAVVGSLLAGFFFVRLIGLEATVLTAGAANVLVGFVALVVGRRASEASLLSAPDPTGESTTGSDHREHEFTSSQARLAVVVAGVSGFCAMMYEVAWVRMLIPVLGSSTYSFTLMLVAFISGARWWPRARTSARNRPVRSTTACTRPRRPHAVKGSTRRNARRATARPPRA